MAEVAKKIVCFLSITILCSSSIARVNISHQSLVDADIQNACDEKYNVEKDILKCISEKYEASDSIKLDYPDASVYEVDFSGFGTGWVLTPSIAKKILIIEIGDNYLYASSIYNLETC
ncbi:hypothetical protein ACJJIL_12680 [Microbulbifer sp. EKSA005]|uniref:hypothetical protein n=1 Tax=Microbulbifer sp. EKSA005 TaxID=3243364 RepID=UPI004042BDAB